MDVAFSMCGTKEGKLYLADQLSQNGDSYYVRWASEIYRNYGEDAKQLEGKQKGTLLRLVSCSDSRRLPELYQDCRQELTMKDFAKEEPGILKIIKDRNLAAYFDILMEKNKTKEVFDYIMHPQEYGRWNVDQGHYFTKRLSGQYPREIVELYWRETAPYVSQGKEVNYARRWGY